DFTALYPTNGSPGDFTSNPDAAADFAGSDPSFLNITGYWDTSSYTAAVPIPAAVWLFGSGLLGLAGIAGKKKT
ncbi:MAG: VPLPA-CTERM sorting domain-containing protein, partial [Gammaproteobacteria bacterium]